MNNSIAFTTTKDVLLKALSNIQPVIENKNVMPILANVKIDIEDSEAIFSGTDMDIAVSTTFKVDSETNGTLTLPCRNLHDIIRKSPSDKDITIRGDAESGKAQIKSKSRFTMPCIKSDEFPIMTRGDMDVEFEVNANDFLQLLNKVKFAVSCDEFKPYLEGVNLRIEGDELIATATDGHKLGRSVLPLERNIDVSQSIILPSKVVNLVSKLSAKLTDFIEIKLSDNKICITCNDFVIISKLVDNTFPNTDALIPSEFTNTLKIDREVILQTIDRISLASDFKNKGVILTINDNVLKISASGGDNLEAEEDVEVDSDINDFRRCFNSKYLIEILSNLTSEIVDIHFNDIKMACVICDAQSDSEKYLVMPMAG